MFCLAVASVLLVAASVQAAQMSPCTACHRSDGGKVCVLGASVKSEADIGRWGPHPFFGIDRADGLDFNNAVATGFNFYLDHAGALDNIMVDNAVSKYFKYDGAAGGGIGWVPTDPAPKSALLWMWLGLKPSGHLAIDVAPSETIGECALHDGVFSSCNKNHGSPTKPEAKAHNVGVVNTLFECAAEQCSGVQVGLPSYPEVKPGVKHPAQADIENPSTYLCCKPKAFGALPAHAKAWLSTLPLADTVMAAKSIPPTAPDLKADALEAALKLVVRPKPKNYPSINQGQIEPAKMQALLTAGSFNDACDLLKERETGKQAQAAMDHALASQPELTAKHVAAAGLSLEVAAPKNDAVGLAALAFTMQPTTVAAAPEPFKGDFWNRRFELRFSKDRVAAEPRDPAELLQRYLLLGDPTAVIVRVVRTVKAKTFAIQGKPIAEAPLAVAKYHHAAPMKRWTVPLTKEKGQLGVNQLLMSVERDEAGKSSVGIILHHFDLVRFLCHVPTEQH